MKLSDKQHWSRSLMNQVPVPLKLALHEKLKGTRMAD